MMDRPRFRRKHQTATGRKASDESAAPVPPLESRAERLARRREEPQAESQSATEEARCRDEAEQQARAEETRRRVEADQQVRAEEAGEAAEDDQRRRDLAEKRRLAEMRARQARADADRLEAEARQVAEEEAEALGHTAKPAALPTEAATSPLALTDPVAAAADNRDTGPAARPGPTAETRPAPAPNRMWSRLGEITVDESHLHRNRIITARRDDPAHTAFDVLRTRLLQALHEKGWKRIAITSPGQGCGKTFTAANLAISLSRQENCRTLLLDCDLRRPTLHQVMGIERPGSVGDMLRGRTSPEDHLKRMGRNPVQAGRNIAFGFNDVVEPYASELLQDPRTAETLNRIETGFGADVMLFDLPPALFYDDVIAFRPMFDGVLLVIGGGLTTEKEIKEVERRLGADTPLLGMVLNKAEGADMTRYTY
ncbi:hypothetical protein [Ponticoccus alexandrii]|nr:hypothetical protein [Ponticoccus alexandrii]